MTVSERQMNKLLSALPEAILDYVEYFGIWALYLEARRQSDKWFRGMSQSAIRTPSHSQKNVTIFKIVSNENSPKI